MAVYKRNYRAYDGPLTSPASRWLVIARYGLGTAFATRVSVIAFVICLVPSLVSTLLIYIANNATVQATLQLRGASALLIGPKFFLGLMEVEGWLALFFTSLIGPAIIGPDLSNNALPLFLSRPLSRAQYIAGKFALLAGVISCLTWVPMLLLFALQFELSNTTWLHDNWFIAPAIFLGSWIWIAVLALVAMAVSAWVRWRVVAIGATIAILLVPGGFGAVVQNVLHTRWGMLLNVPLIMTLIWTNLMRVPMMLPHGIVPVWSAWAAMFATAFVAFFLLHRRIQARQVVRG